jgi:hypothetical protein
MITKFKIFESFNEFDPYGEEIWDEEKFIPEMYEWLSKQVDLSSLDYELIFDDKDNTIKLLKNENGNLKQDPEFYFSVYTTGGYDVKAYYYYLFPHNGEYILNRNELSCVTIEDRKSILRRLKEVLEYIKYRKENPIPR